MILAIGHTLRAHEALSRPDALAGFLEVVHRLFEDGVFVGHSLSIRTSGILRSLDCFAFSREHSDWALLGRGTDEESWVQIRQPRESLHVPRCDGQVVVGRNAALREAHSGFVKTIRFSELSHFSPFCVSCGHYRG